MSAPTIKRDDPKATRLLMEQAAVAKRPGEHAGNQYTERKPDNVRTSVGYGNSQSHTLARLKRDRPDLAKRVIGGDLSANAIRLLTLALAGTTMC